MTASPKPARALLSDVVEDWKKSALDRVRQVGTRTVVERIGRVEHVGDGIATVSGLTEARVNELLAFPGDTFGFALALGESEIGCVLLGGTREVVAGDIVHGTGAVVRVPVGEHLLGRIIDPIGRPLDGGDAIAADHLEPVERPAPAIIDRGLVTEALQTGILSIDSMFALGRGQRELIVGDRVTGKTCVALDTMIEQKRTDVICIYVAIGQKSSAVARAIDAVRRNGAFDRCVFVIAESSMPPGLQWLAPYAGFTIGEYFRDRGQHALVVLDDLTRHAATHREIALLLREPPGREAYPGDVFHIHARLLERAAKLSPELGGGSLSALPIAETQAANLSAYIPTNLISITDGQIVLDSKLFNEGQKPAVDVGLSVSRVGGKTQAPAMRTVVESLRLDYAQFLELELFTRFGAIFDERTRRTIEHGRRIRAILSQPQHSPMSLSSEVALLLALSVGLLDQMEVEKIPAFRAALPKWLHEQAGPVVDEMDRDGLLTDERRALLEAALRSLAARLARGPDGRA
jgi:F-type H+-transporting ATPase subunit alpha